MTIYKSNDLSEREDLIERLLFGATKFREQAAKTSVLGATDEDNARLISVAEKLEAEANSKQ